MGKYTLTIKLTYRTLKITTQVSVLQSLEIITQISYSNTKKQITKYNIEIHNRNSFFHFLNNNEKFYLNLRTFLKSSISSNLLHHIESINSIGLLKI